MHKQLALIENILAQILPYDEQAFFQSYITVDNGAARKHSINIFGAHQQIQTYAQKSIQSKFNGITSSSTFLCMEVRWDNK